jgi:hypothetical protein
MTILNKKPRRCKDGTLDMRCRENFGHDKFERIERPKDEKEIYELKEIIEGLRRQVLEDKAKSNKKFKEFYQYHQ